MLEEVKVYFLKKSGEFYSMKTLTVEIVDGWTKEYLRNGVFNFNWKPIIEQIINKYKDDKKFQRMYIFVTHPKANPVLITPKQREQYFNN